MLLHMQCPSYGMMKMVIVEDEYNRYICLLLQSLNHGGVRFSDVISTHV